MIRAVVQAADDRDMLLVRDEAPGVACSHLGSVIRFFRVRIFSRNTLVEFWRRYPDAEVPLRLWFAMVERASWSSPAEVRAMFGSADFLANNRVIFDIKGNTYRLIAQIKYAPLFLVFIRFVGTHAEYDRIDANKV